MFKTLGDAESYEVPASDAAEPAAGQGAPAPVTIRLAPVGENFDQPTDTG